MKETGTDSDAAPYSDIIQHQGSGGRGEGGCESGAEWLTERLR
jgi:phage terminase large subunit-like protein